MYNKIHSVSRRVIISFLSAVALMLWSVHVANSALNMGGKVIYTGTLIKVLEPRPDIQGIIGNITDASESKLYLIHLGAGVYDLGDSNIVMKEWVSIQGLGQESTKITRVATINAPTWALRSTVVGADNVSLTDLTVVSVAGVYDSVGIYL